jgi:cbb3-type cytochrome oxidase maturation protein
MNILGFLIPLALFLGLLFLLFFFWSVVSGQYDDLETPACRILDKKGEKE